MKKEDLAKKIDHTMLGPEVSLETVKEGVQYALDNHVASVVVSPDRLQYVAEKLKGSGVSACTVIGFPHGTHSIATKVFETEEAVKNGAQEVDMVINVGYLKEGEDDSVKEEISAVVEASGDALVKVIIESAFLSDEEIKKACLLSEEAGADFVKTSTGYAPQGGARVEAVRLMKETVGDRLQVKASGGIRTAQDCFVMIKAGADRIGASRTKDILEGLA